MSLSHHLLEPGDHGRLGFHPRCAVCRRERLAGVLAARPVVSRRAQAALAAGVLAFSASGAPVAAIAAEPDSDQEGQVDPGATSPQDIAGGPDLDPGGNDTDTPSEGDQGEPPAGPGGEEDGGPVAQPPAGVQEHLVEAPESPPAPVPAAPVGPVQAPSVPSSAPEAWPEPKQAAKPRQPRRARSKGARQFIRTAPTATAAPAPAAAPAQQSQSAAVPTGSPAGTEAAAAAKAPASDQTYVVKSGDSLWSIARGLLGADASAAMIANEVNRLWRLNGERIGTGDPDLIMAGQALRLR